MHLMCIADSFRILKGNGYTFEKKEIRSICHFSLVNRRLLLLLTTMFIFAEKPIHSTDVALKSICISGLCPTMTQSAHSRPTQLHLISRPWPPNIAYVRRLVYKVKRSPIRLQTTIYDQPVYRCCHEKPPSNS